MSTPKKKVGDRVMITAGQAKDKVGVIVDKERRGWVIELEDGSRVTASFPMVVLVKVSAQAEQAGDEPETTEVEAPSAAVEASGEADPTSQAAETATATASEGEQDVAKMTVKQLQALAKQRGVSVARTKADFYRIIKAMNPDEDLALLKGKALFDRVKELHISRLRSKEEMARLLSA